MPKDFGPAGKWIHDRAHGIMKDNPEMPKSQAYAIATQQGHKVGKSPKDFRTPQGVHEAKMKYDEPKSEYQKTAMWAGFFDELEGIEKEALPSLKQTVAATGIGLATLKGAPAAKAMLKAPVTVTQAVQGVKSTVQKPSLFKKLFGSGSEGTKRIGTAGGSSRLGDLAEAQR